MQLETPIEKGDGPHLKIQKVELIPVSVKYKREVKTFYGARQGADTVLVKIHTDNRLFGVGEGGATIPLYLGETQATIMSVIKDILAPKVLIGEDPLNINKIIDRMDYLILGNTQAKACIDIALHDLAGKIMDIPLNKFLGGSGSDGVPMGYVACSTELAALTEEVAQVARAGFNHINIKVASGTTPEEDVERFAAVRAAVGDKVKLTIDANTGWTPYVASKTIEKMKKYDIYASEQPTKEIRGMKEVKDNTRVTMVVDESARRLSDLARIIQIGAADVVGIKLARVGGLYRTKQLVAIAESVEMPVEMLSTVGSGILTSAESHMVTSSLWFNQWGAGHKTASGVLQVTGEFDSSNYPGDLVKNTAKVERGRLYPPRGPGLGVELDEDFVARAIPPGSKPVVITS